MNVANATQKPIGSRETLTGKLSKRIAARKPRSSKFLLSQKNIYIFPSKAGFAFCMMLVLMLLTAINYQSSLVYLITFIFGAIFKISIWLCFFNMRGLVVEAADSDDLFEGEELKFKVSLSRDRSSTYGLEAAVRDSGESTIVQISPGNSASVVLVDGKMAKRGLHKIERLGLSSYYPFGLIKAWTWLGLDATALVYPKPLNPGDSVTSGVEQDNEGHDLKSDQLDMLRNYSKGDVMTRVHWKKYASSEQLVVREGESVGSAGQWLRWEEYSQYDNETALSYLCFMVLKYGKSGAPYGLDIPGNLIQPDSGVFHQKKCLRALALFGTH